MQNINTETLKKIIREIFEEEKQMHNLQTTINPITVLSFYKDYANEFMRNQSLKTKFSMATLPIRASGVHFFDREGKEEQIYIFLKNQNNIQEVDQNLYRILQVCYHEIYHSIQGNNDKYSYAGFLDDIDKFLQQQSSNDYHIEHDKYSYEIGANLYGATKAAEYLQKHYPDIYEQEKEQIENIQQRCKYYYMTYDASDTIERMILAAKTQLQNDNKQEMENMDQISPVLGIFLNSDMSFKNLDEIITQEKFKSLDKRIVYAFLSSKTFLESINLEQLTDESLNLLSESLQYTSIVYQNQFQWLEKEKSINLKQFLKTESSILKKYALIHNYYARKVAHTLNYARSDKKREMHMQSIPYYLEETKQEVKRRTLSKGHITINICYIIGAILSISTIIYLLVK